MDIHPRISFSTRLSLREFDSELWRLYFGFVKGFLMMTASFLYLFVLITFFVAQHAAFAASKFAGWVTDWNPEKPQAFEVRPVDGD